MNLKIREGMINLFAYLGVIALLMGIFLIPDFGIGFLIAFVFWTVSATLSTLYKEERDIHGKSLGLKINLKEGIATAMSMIGVFVLLIGIFLDGASFEVMLFIAIVIWIMTGAVTGFFGEDTGIDDLRSTKFANKFTKKPNITPYVRNVPNNPEVSPNKNYYEGEPDSKFNEEKERYCKNCGTIVTMNSVFCDNCGSQL